MRTPPMSDEELDGLFRRSAEAYPDTTELPLGAWQQLQEQLDDATQQQLIRRQVQRRVGRLFVLELLLVALCLLWWQGGKLISVAEYSRPHGVPAASLPEVAANSAPVAWPKTSAPKPTATLPQQKTTVARLTDTAPAPARTIPASDGTPQTARQTTPQAAAQTTPAPPAARPRYRLVLTPAPEPAKPERTIAAERSLAPAPPASEAAIRLISPLASSRTSESAPETAANPREAVATTGSTAAGAETTAAGATREQEVPKAESQPAPTLLTAAPDSGKTLASKPLVAGSPALNPLPLPADSGQTKPPRERPAYRVLLGVMGAPELTAVHTSELTRPGATLGAVAEYRITTRLRVRGGLLYSKKLYQARGSDYRPPASYWTWRTPVDRIAADCRIIEIPLDLRYELLQRPAYSLFASAGLSSLLMRNEVYTYDYTLNGQAMQRTWSLARGSNHPLSLLSLSVGYERPLSTRWVAQAEPFLKLPLGGVGFGNIRLRSAGVSFGFKYGLLPSRPTVRLP